MSGSTLLSCATSLKLDLIKLHPRLGVPPPKAKIITSQADQTSPAAKRVTQGKVVFDEMQSTVHVPSVKPLTTPFRGLLQLCTGAPFKREPSVIGKWARYQNDQHNKMSSMVPRSAPYDCPIQPLFKPHTAPFRTPIQNPHKGAPFKRELSVIGKQARYQNNWHDETSSMVPRSAPYDCPIWPLFKPLMAPFRTPIQNPHTGAPFKRELSAIGKQARHQNDQDINTSSMVSRSALYDCPIWPPFKPLMAPFKTPIQDPHSKEITSPYSITRYTKMFSSTSREKCTLWDLLSTANSLTNGTPSNMFRVYVYWKTQKQYTWKMPKDYEYDFFKNK